MRKTTTHHEPTKRPICTSAWPNGDWRDRGSALKASIQPMKNAQTRSPYDIVLKKTNTDGPKNSGSSNENRMSFHQAVVRLRKRLTALGLPLRPGGRVRSLGVSRRFSSNRKGGQKLKKSVSVL